MWSAAHVTSTSRWNVSAVPLFVVSEGKPGLEQKHGSPFMENIYYVTLSLIHVMVTDRGTPQKFREILKLPRFNHRHLFFVFWFCCLTLSSEKAVKKRTKIWFHSSESMYI